jgi:nucleoside 2-deoxyribosyltransferase
MYKYDVYCAGPWFTRQQEENNEHIISLVKKFNLKAFCPRYDAGELKQDPNKKLTLDVAKNLFAADISGLDDSETIIADISTRDSGTLIEVGYMYCLHKKIILFDNGTSPKANIMLAGLASSYVRNFVELEDVLNGEVVFDLGEKELE